MLSPRVLIIQASPDRTSDYNALMNCAFAANKSEIVIDGCFVPSGTKDDRATSSPYLQQLVDRTGGVYLSVPSGAAQVGGALSEVLVSVFLPPPSVRGGMNLPGCTTSISALGASRRGRASTWRRYAISA
jgi:transcription initiation factor TFIIH subunit 3